MSSGRPIATSPFGIPTPKPRRAGPPPTADPDRFRPRLTSATGSSPWSSPPSSPLSSLLWRAWVWRIRRPGFDTRSDTWSRRDGPADAPARRRAPRRDPEQRRHRVLAAPGNDHRPGRPPGIYAWETRPGDRSRPAGVRRRPGLPRGSPRPMYREARFRRHPLGEAERDQALAALDRLHGAGTAYDRGGAGRPRHQGPRRRGRDATTYRAARPRLAPGRPGRVPRSPRAWSSTSVCSARGVAALTWYSLPPRPTMSFS